MSLITLTTDFGTADGYVGAVKGAILSINPKVTLVDLSHGIPSFNILQGAFLLGTSFSLFPKGTIHLAVVDPGVGSARRPLLVVTRDWFFVAPDNGLLSVVVGTQRPSKIIELTVERYFLPSPSHTFHGRDIFGPVAAHLSRGVAPTLFGRPRSSLVELPAFKTRPMANGDLKGEILFLDKFGNAISNIRPLKRRGLLELWSGAHYRGGMLSLCRTYSDLPKGKPGALFGSSGFLELALYEDSFGKRFSASKGEEILLKKGAPRD